MRSLRPSGAPSTATEAWLTTTCARAEDTRHRANAEMIAIGIPEVAVDGEVISDPPKKLVQTYRFLFNDARRPKVSRGSTWEIEATQSGFSG